MLRGGQNFCLGGKYFSICAEFPQTKPDSPGIFPMIHFPQGPKMNGLLFGDITEAGINVKAL